MSIAYNLRISDGSGELQRGLKIAAARKGISVRDFVLATMYDALNRELRDVSPIWKQITFQEFEERQQMGRERRSNAARSAVMARWHPELRVTNESQDAPVKPEANGGVKSKIRCPLNSEHAAVRRDDGLWCGTCERLYLLAG